MDPPSASAEPRPNPACCGEPTDHIREEKRPSDQVCSDVAGRILVQTLTTLLRPTRPVCSVFEVSTRPVGGEDRLFTRPVCGVPLCSPPVHFVGFQEQEVGLENITRPVCGVSPVRFVECQETLPVQLVGRMTRPPVQFVAFRPSSLWSSSMEQRPTRWDTPALKMILLM